MPYFAWQYSHKKHHLCTNHLIEGETHVPPTAKGFGVTERGYKAMAAAGEALGEDAFAFLQLVGHLLLGWPLYLLRNDTGGRETWDGKRKGGQLLDRFRPSSQLFKDKVRTKIALGTVGIVLWVAFLVKMAMDHGTMAVSLWYIGPYLWVNFWLVLYTWMHHTSLDVPHYGKEDWTWVRGALCTIDRDYGVFDWFHHDIGSTHVAHHLFHEMPFFHAKEATAALKDFLGPLYNYDGTNIAVAAWRVARDCHYVEGLEGAQYYKTLPKRHPDVSPQKEEYWGHVNCIGIRSCYDEGVSPSFFDRGQLCFSDAAFSRTSVCSPARFHVWIPPALCAWCTRSPVCLEERGGQRRPLTDGFDPMVPMSLSPCSLLNSAQVKAKAAK